MLATLLVPDQVSSPPEGPDLTRYVAVCLGLLGAVLLLAYFFRRFVADGLQRRAALRSLQIVDVLPLGRRQKLAVVRCYDRSFLLGLGEKEIHSIAELESTPEATGPTELSEDPPPPEAEAPAFPEELVRAIEATPARRSGRGAGATTAQREPEARFPRGRGLLG